MVQVVGILGFKGSGKDTAGEYLVREHGFELESFANPLKDAVSAVFGWDRNLLEGSTEESRSWRELPDTWWEQKLNWDSHPGKKLSQRFTPRFALQYFGTEIFRGHFHDDIWILSLSNRIRDKERVVITDCRFPNEFQTIKQFNGLTFRVKRGPDPDWYDIAYRASMKDPDALKLINSIGIHSSEWAWLSCPFDAVIENSGTISDLQENVKCLIQNFSW